MLAFYTTYAARQIGEVLAVVWLAGLATAGGAWLARAIARQVRRHRMLARLEAWR